MHQSDWNEPLEREADDFEGPAGPVAVLPEPREASDFIGWSTRPLLTPVRPWSVLCMWRI